MYLRAILHSEYTMKADGVPLNIPRMPSLRSASNCENRAKSANLSRIIVALESHTRTASNVTNENHMYAGLFVHVYAASFASFVRASWNNFARAKKRAVFARRRKIIDTPDHLYAQTRTKHTGNSKRHFLLACVHASFTSPSHGASHRVQKSVYFA